MVCKQCGANISETAKFCEACGVKQGVSVVETQTAEPENSYSEKKVSASISRKAMLSVIIIALLGTIAVIISEFSGGVKSITLKNNELIICTGDQVQLDYSILPEDATYDLIWSSTNVEIASVSKKGVVSGISEGNCIVAVTADNKKTAECKVTVKYGLATAYKNCCNSAVSELSLDRKSITIRTKPGNNNKTLYYHSSELEEFALESIISLNNKLDIPDALYDRMMQTRALDGTQSSEYNDIYISWTYHPDDGLTVIYEQR